MELPGGGGGGGSGGSGCGGCGGSCGVWRSLFLQDQVGSVFGCCC